MMMTSSRPRLLPVLLGGVMLCFGAGSAMAQDFASMSCDDLWQSRNQIYADEGYCFKTARAIEEFGRRCYPPYGRLTGYEQREIAEIQRWEARYRCN